MGGAEYKGFSPATDLTAEQKTIFEQIVLIGKPLLMVSG